MKRLTKTLLAVMAASIFCFATCSKKDDKPNDSSTSDKLIGKWTYVNVIVKQTIGSDIIKNDTTVYEPGSEVTFKEDGSFRSVTVVGNVTAEDNGSWSIAENGQLVLTIPNVTTGRSVQLRNLTATSFQLYDKVTDASYMQETTTTFKR